MSAVLTMEDVSRHVTILQEVITAFVVLALIWMHKAIAQVIIMLHIYF